MTLLATTAARSAPFETVTYSCSHVHLMGAEVVYLENYWCEQKRRASYLHHRTLMRVVAARFPLPEDIVRHILDTMHPIVLVDSIGRIYACPPMRGVSPPCVFRIRRR